MPAFSAVQRRLMELITDFFETSCVGAFLSALGSFRLNDKYQFGPV